MLPPSLIRTSKFSGHFVVNTGGDFTFPVNSNEMVKLSSVPSTTSLTISGVMPLTLEVIFSRTLLALIRRLDIFALGMGLLPFTTLLVPVLFIQFQGSASLVDLLMMLTGSSG